MNRNTPEHSRAALPVALLLLGCAAGCAPGPPPVSHPRTLCKDAQPSGPCRSARDVEGWLARPDLEILEAAPTREGGQEARVLKLRVPGDGIVFRAKWRAWWTANRHNLPRSELAAHAVQRLFLRPHEYVVPPAAGYCFPLEAYREGVEPQRGSTFTGIPCVFGVLSYWLEDAHGAKEALLDDRIEALLDEELFWTNATYRESIARVNLLAHLISHGDTHVRQFVLTGSFSKPYVQLVDNSLAFSRYRNPDIPSVDDLSLLQVPALPRAAIERLRRADVEALAVIEQYRVVNGMLVKTHASAPADRRRGVRWRGRELQLGLDAEQLAEVRRRIAAVLARADASDIVLF